LPLKEGQALFAEIEKPARQEADLLPELRPRFAQRDNGRASTIFRKPLLLEPSETRPRAPGSLDAAAGETA
jgi:hypothetical protein